MSNDVKVINVKLDADTKNKKGLRLQLELMKEKTNRFNLELMSLNTIDVLFRRKHKNIIYDFQDEFTQISKDKPVEIEK